jgi:cardiolipin synthase
MEQEKNYKIFTIPNLLSIFRLVLALLFGSIWFGYGGRTESREILTVILIISGITDFLDGFIARKFNMVSELGKLLDPIADKVTQGVLLICFFSEYKLVKYVLLLFLVKECTMAAMGTKTMINTGVNDGARWYGKVSTAVFYIVMVVLFLFPGIPETTANTLILCSGACMLLALIMYLRHYYLLEKKVIQGDLFYEV